MSPDLSPLVFIAAMIALACALLGGLYFLFRDEPDLTRRLRRRSSGHDYKRHGTTTLFAALEIASGKVLGEHSKRRSVETIRNPAMSCVDENVEQTDDTEDVRAAAH